MNNTELQQLMKESAQDAVLFAQEHHQLALDFSLESLVLVDDLLDQVHLQQFSQRLSDEHMFALCNIMGAYLGQVFMAVVGGEWVHQKADETAPYVSLNYNNREFPLASLVYNKICNNRSISVRDYVQQAISNAMQ